jgi:hypothetical protein
MKRRRSCESDATIGGHEAARLYRAGVAGYDLLRRKESAMRRLAPFVAQVLLGALGVAGGLGAGPLAEKKTADVQVWAIRATTKNQEISPELKPIADKLRANFKYTGFKLEKRERGTTEIGKAFHAALISPYKASVTPKSIEQKRVQLQIQVRKEGEDKPLIDATVTTNVGEFQLSGGPELGGGDALIVAVSTR